MPREGAPLPDMKNYPILNQQEAARIFEAVFQKDCGNNDICESNLQVAAKLNLSGKYLISFYLNLCSDKVIIFILMIKYDNTIKNIIILIIKQNVITD